MAYRHQLRILARKRVAEIIRWLDSGERPTESELATYRAKLAAYAASGKQQGLPFAPVDR